MAFLDDRGRAVDGGGPVVMAHRGLSASLTGGVHDENSLAAFERAVTAGVRYLETDVRVSADGVALAFHDAVLDRVTDRRGIVAALPWTTVGQARIGGAEPIPLLEDVLGAFPDVRVNIDVKSDRGVEPTLRALTRTRARDRICLAAFSDRRLARLRRRLGPQVATALGPGEIARLRLASRRRARGLEHRPGADDQRQPLPAPAFTTHRVVQIPDRLGLLPVFDRRLLAHAHAAGLPVHVWTVNDPARMGALLDLGVDGLITDRADLAVPLATGTRR